MLKRIGVIAGSAAAGLVMLGGVASADGGQAPRMLDDDDQVGLLNLNNLDVLHNVNAVAGVCDNNINVLGVQVPVEDVANGIGVPILSPGHNEADGETPENCASAGIANGGSVQDD